MIDQLIDRLPDDLKSFSAHSKLIPIVSKLSDDKMIPAIGSVEELQYLLLFERATPNAEKSFLVKEIGRLQDLDFEYKPVSVKEFLEGKSYLNKKDEIWPGIKDHVIEIFEGEDHDIRKNESVPWTEAIATGSIGWGKDYLDALCLIRMVYEFSCLVSPQRYHGLDPDTPLIFPIMSVTGGTAADSIFTYLSNFCKSSEYFNSVFPHKIVGGSIIFGKNIMIKCGNSSEFSAIGRNVPGGVITEANFMVSASRAKHEKLAGVEDHATALYRAMKRRIKSRMVQSHKYPGKLFLNSSAQFPDDFLSRQIDSVRREKVSGVYIMEHTQWDTRDPEDYKEPKFQVVLAGEGHQGFIVENQDQLKDIPDDAEIVTVPGEYMEDFKIDFEGSCRDIIGKATITQHPYIPQRHLIDLAVECGEEFKLNIYHPFTSWETNFKDSVELEVLKICDFVPYENKKDKDFYGVDGFWRPKMYPDKTRYLHFDIGITGDSYGVGCGYSPYHVTREIEDPKTKQKIPISIPFIVIEFAMRFNPPPNDEVDLATVRNIIVELMNKGFMVGCMSSDTFQSRDSLQILTSLGYKTKALSVDRTIDPYNYYKESIRDKRIALPPHPTLIRETKKLIYDRKTNKVDHPPMDSQNIPRLVGSKDLADCAAGVCWHIMENHANNRTAMVPTVGNLEEDKDDLLAAEATSWLLDS